VTGPGGETAPDAASGPGERGEDGFEEALERLEAIVARLERDELELDEALALFEEGVGRLRSAGRRLGEARDRVEELVENAAGELEVVELVVEEEAGTEGPEGSEGTGGNANG